MKYFISFISLWLVSNAFAQPVINGFAFDQSTDLKVIKNGDSLINAWCGGMSFVSVNTMDLDGNGVEDLVLFEKTGQRVLTFINRAGANQTPEYKYDFTYSEAFPQDFHFQSPDLAVFFLLKDYNCDGKKDIFVGISNSIKVYTNTSQSGNLSFTPYNGGAKLQALWSSGMSHLSNGNDLPVIDDIDNDGDLDILKFDGSRVVWLENTDPCGLNFVASQNCWGGFLEDAFGNSITLDGCIPYKPKKGTSNKNKTMHEGGTLLALNLDGIGGKDLLIADVEFPEIKALFNTGTIDTAHVSSYDSTFPSYSTPLNLPVYPAPYYEDVTGDGTKDLIISPHDVGNNILSPYITQNNLWLYEDISSGTTPNFQLKTKNFLRNTMLDFGDGAVPRFVDIDGDSLQDIIVSNSSYHPTMTDRIPAFALLKNTGSATMPVYTLVDTNFLNMSSYTGIGLDLVPTFGDLDNDNDFDMIVGNDAGDLFYFENVGSATNPQYQVNTSLHLNQFSLGNFTAPFLFDMDRDGDLDLIVGKRIGRLSYLENVNGYFPRHNTDYFGGVDVSSGIGGSGFSIPYVFEQDSIINLMVSGKYGVYQYDSVDAVVDIPSINAQVGTDNLVSANQDESILGRTEKVNKNQLLFLASELQAAGMSYGYITGITIDIADEGNGNVPIYNGFNISLKNSSMTSLQNGFETGLTQVSSELFHPTANGEYYIPIDPFLWDGVSNLVVQTCYNEVNKGAHIKMRSSNTSFASNAYGDAILGGGGPSGCNLQFKAAVNKRPNIKFDFKPSFVNTASEFISDGIRNAIAFADINGDGFIDAVAGNYAGGLTYYKGKYYHIGLDEPRSFNKQGLEVFPNPGNGLYTVNTKNFGKAELQIFSMQGNLIKTIAITEAETTVDLQNQASGLYLFVVQEGNTLKTQKVIKE